MISIRSIIVERLREKLKEQEGRDLLYNELVLSPIYNLEGWDVNLNDTDDIHANS